MLPEIGTNTDWSEPTVLTLFLSSSRTITIRASFVSTGHYGRVTGHYGKCVIDEGKLKGTAFDAVCETNIFPLTIGNEPKRSSLWTSDRPPSGLRAS